MRAPHLSNHTEGISYLMGWAGRVQLGTSPATSFWGSRPSYFSLPRLPTSTLIPEFLYLLIPTRGLARDTGPGLPRLDGDDRVVAAADVHDAILATPQPENCPESGNSEASTGRLTNNTTWPDRRTG